MELPEFDRSWTLFLDRDGVLNERIIGDYVRRPEQFVWLPGVVEALQIFRSKFGRLIVVSNQQGVGKGIMTQADLDSIHERMLGQCRLFNVEIDAVFVATALATENHPDRKPNVGMAVRAKEQFPEIDFSRSVMCGDTSGDMAFAKTLGMLRVGIADESLDAHFHFDRLYQFAQAIEAIFAPEEEE